MTVQIAILVAYFLVILLIGFLARSKLSASPADYFLANRNISGVLMIFTMVATNFSAFTVYGASGAGFRDGYSFFPIMGFGTGFMAISFWFIGRKAWEYSKEKGIITPSELVGSLYDNRFLTVLFALVMIFFTVPYLALQPMAAGYVMQELFGLNYFTGCIIVTAVILLYTLRGGMKAVVWTDLVQGSLMFILLVVSLVLVARYYGGFVRANERVLADFPSLFARPGGEGKYLIGIWFGYMALWFFCDPMFPQLFQRFFAARDKKTLSLTMIAYPAVCTAVFILPVSLGVMGRLSHPHLTGRAADSILPIMLTEISGSAMATLVMAAGLAALMSTMDSQLLTMGSIFSRDIAPIMQKKKSSITGRVFVVLLAIAGLALAYKPPDTILQIATQSFTGLAMLFPATLFGLYFKKKFAISAIMSIISGLIMVALYYFKILAANAFLPVIPAITVSILVYLITHLAILIYRKELDFVFPTWLKDPYIIVYLLIFLLAHDVWNWGQTGRIVVGIPLWAFYFVGLSAVQTLVMVVMVRKREK